MAHVVLLRGVNVGGHRSFRPTVLASQLKHLDVVNIGAAGTLVVRKPISVASLRAEVIRRLPFKAEVMVLPARQFLSVVLGSRFGAQSLPADEVRFLSVLARRPRFALAVPKSFPARGKWLMRIVARDGRFVFGHYRRHMKVIGYLGTLDRHFGVPATTRNWNTVAAIIRVLNVGGA